MKMMMTTTTIDEVVYSILGSFPHQRAATGERVVTAVILCVLHFEILSLNFLLNVVNFPYFLSYGGLKVGRS